MVENQMIILDEMKQFYEKHFLEREPDEQT